jgi:hypothetical protein
LFVTAIFAILATAMNHTGRNKKHQELILKAKQLKRKYHNINPHLEEKIQNACKNALTIDKIFTLLSYLLIVTFIVTSGISAIERSKGNIAESAIPDIIGNSSYLLAMLVAIANKIIGSVLQSRIEKEHLSPYQSKNKDEETLPIVDNVINYDERDQHYMVSNNI